MSGARTIATGSLGKTGVPSSIANRSPVKRKSLKYWPKTTRNEAKLGQFTQIFDFFVGKAEIQEVIDELGDPRHEDEVAPLGETAEGELKGGFLLDLAGLEETGCHGQLVEVGEKAVHFLAFSYQLSAVYFFFSAGGAGAASFTSAAAFCRSSTALPSSS